MTALLVTVAGGLGVLVRHLLSSSLHGPWTIVAINVAESFLIGLLVSVVFGVLAAAAGFWLAGGV
ncbi:MAG TPA: hypothetical protein VGW11_08315 [Solirubrobacteraceae bacterium]|nr:hypothetical protein [Solirubrobacteraceae bacterium]